MGCEEKGRKGCEIEDGRMRAYPAGQMHLVAFSASSYVRKKPFPARGLDPWTGEQSRAASARFEALCVASPGLEPLCG